MTIPVNTSPAYRQPNDRWSEVERSRVERAVAAMVIENRSALIDLDATALAARAMALSKRITAYPAEERLVDTANQYHLWVFDSPTFRLSIGYHERLVAEGPYQSSARQRPWKPGSRPADCIDSVTIERRAASTLWREGHMQE